MAMHPKTVVIVDGENLVCRYQSMCNNGSTPKNNILHEKDIYVWSRDLFQSHNTEKDILRISYFTCFTGDEIKFSQISDVIGWIKYSNMSGRSVRPLMNEGTLNPRLFKKGRNQDTTKKIDIAMVIDAINYSMLDNIDEIHIMSGDADFIPVIQEIMRKGKKVVVSSFSSGVSEEMKYTPDVYECLDSIFFKTPNET